MEISSKYLVANATYEDTSKTEFGWIWEWEFNSKLGIPPGFLSIDITNGKDNLSMLIPSSTFFSRNKQTNKKQGL